MRYVQRRWTKWKHWTPPAPWSFRPVWSYGPPRVCRSNYADPVKVDGTVVGYFDPMLHLYSKHPTKSDEETVLVQIGLDHWVLYDLSEWGLVTEKAYWLEFVSDRWEGVGRLSRQVAATHGMVMEHAGRRMYAVPWKHYEVLSR